MYSNRLCLTVVVLLLIPIIGFAKPKHRSPLEANPLRDKLETIIITKMAFMDTRASTVFEFLNLQSKALDPEGKGVAFTLKLRPMGQSVKKDEEPTVTLDLDALPLYDMIRYACYYANLRFKIENGSVVILGPDVEESDFEYRWFNVPAPIIDNWKASIGSRNLQDYFHDMGVNFPTITCADGIERIANLSYIRETDTLAIYNLPENNERLRTILKHIVLKQKPEGEMVIEKKLRTIIIPKIAFEDVRLSIVLEFLRMYSRRLDPDNYTLNIVSSDRITFGNLFDAATPKLDKEDEFIEDDDDFWADDDDGDGWGEDEEMAVGEPTITMDFDNIPLGRAIYYICQIADLQYTVERGALVILGADGGHGVPMSLRFFPLKAEIVDGITDNGTKSLKETFNKLGALSARGLSNEPSTLTYDRSSGLVVSMNSFPGHQITRHIVTNISNPPKTLYENPLDEKLDSIMLRNVSFQNTDVTKVLEFIKEQSRQMSPDSLGINFLLIRKSNIWGDEEDETPDSKIAINIANVSIRNAIDAICKKLKMSYLVEDNAVVLRDIEDNDILFDLTFLPVDLELFQGQQPKAYFEEKGVTFPSLADGQKACVILDPQNHQIIVQNTTENIRKMRTIMRTAQK